MMLKPCAFLLLVVAFTLGLAKTECLLDGYERD